MAALTGTNLVENLYTHGTEMTIIGKYALADTIASGDTITWDNIFPVGTKTIVGFEWYGAEFDTHASPTGTLIVGDETDDNGFITSSVVGSANAQFSLKGNGAYMGTTTTGRDIVATVGGTLATAATSGTVYVKATYICGAV